MRKDDPQWRETGRGRGKGETEESFRYMDPLLSYGRVYVCADGAPLSSDVDVLYVALLSGYNIVLAADSGDEIGAVNLPF